MSKLIFGCGYLGRRVARIWREAGEQVVVVTRSGDRAREFAAEGYTAIVADVTQPESLANLPAAETVLYAVGYDRHAGRSVHEVFAGGLKSVLDALAETTQKIITISSTGVYGQSQGEWVDEDSECRPGRAGGEACLAAERVLAAHRLAKRGIALRMAGLYGPGRIPRADEIRRGQPTAAPELGYLNLIHVEDAARAVVAAEERAEPPRTYVVSDGHPVDRREYFAELARLVGGPPPQFAPPAPGDAAAARAVSGKQVRNARMTTELRVSLAYPTYREGLAAILAEEGAGGAR